MRESNSTGRLVSRLIETELGEHVLFRDYGLAVTDDAQPLTRVELQSKIEQFYPGSAIKSFEVVEADSTGTFKLNVDVEGLAQ